MKGSTYFKRIALFVLANLGIMVVLGVVVQLTGLEPYLHQRGIGLDLGALLAMSAIIGFAGSLISLAASKFMAKMFTGAKVIDRPRDDVEAWLFQTVGALSKQAGIGQPEIAIFDSPEPNAFATGARRDNALVAVSTGLLSRMRKDEVEAVLAHEIAHVANGDMVTMALLQGVLNTFVFFLSRVVGYLVDRVLLRNDREGHGVGFFVTTIAAQVVLGILATVVVMAFSRRREFRADAGAAKLVGPQPMIAALERLKSAKEEPNQLPDSLAAFGIRSGPGWMKLFLSHPPLEDRIAALRQSGAPTPAAW